MTLPSRSVALTLLVLTAATACEHQGTGPIAGLADRPASSVIPTTNTSTLEVRIDNPEDGETVSGTVSIDVRTRERDVQRERTDVFVGETLVTSNTAERFSYAWSTAGYSGSQTITAVGWDVEGKSALASVTVTVPTSGGDPPPDDPPPPEDPTPTSLTLDPESVTAGETSTGTVVLSAAAPAGGTAVSLVSNNTSAATVPPSVTVAEGQTTATFTVTTHPVAAGTGVAISANSGGTTRTASLWITPAGVTLDALTLAPTVVASGETSEGTVTLTGPAPDGGAAVALLSHDTTRATVPPAVTVPAGATSATFTVTAQTVESNVAVNIEGTYGGVTRFDRLTVTPPPPGDGELASLTIVPDLVVGGETAQGTVTLGAAAGSDTQVTLTSTDVSVATVPPSVTVPAGATSATFPVTTLVNTSGTGQFSVIVGEAGGVTRSATITTTAAPSGPAVTALNLFPSSLGGGGAATGIVDFDGVIDDGVLFNYTVSHPDIVTVLNFHLDAPAGENATARFWSPTQRAFGVATQPVSSTVVVTITATACCGAVGQASATLTVTPDAPPPPDAVRITRARWTPGGTGGTLDVRATSTSSTALLSAYIAGTDRFLMALRPTGNGRYEGEQSFGGGMTNPGDIEVRSNLGGVETSRVR
jgi:hypothetical protein